MRRLALSLFCLFFAWNWALAALPSGNVGSAYSYTLTALGGQPPYTYTLTSGTLPTGLGLNGTSGLISGTPTVAVSADPLTFTVTDSLLNSVPKATTLTINGTAGSCPVTVGGLTLSVSVPRSAAISPNFVWFDATATTDTLTNTYGANTVPQDVYFSWNYGDTGASGTGSWAYGSNPGANSMNVSTGIVGGHLYVVPDGSGDQNYSVTVTATDGTNTASCTIGVTTYDPAGSNGYAGTNTICVGATTTPVAGSGGCPSGAAVLLQANYVTALGSLAANKRMLFHCGDTFTGTTWQNSFSHYSIDEWGSCTGSNRPIFKPTGGSEVIHPGGSSAVSVGDYRITNIDFECTSSTSTDAIWEDAFPVTSTVITYQGTWSNLVSNGCYEAYGYSQGAQMAIVGSTATGNGNIEAYGNFSENNPPYTGNVINNLTYSAFIGNQFNGIGTATSSGIEVLRISACQQCIIADNNLQNASNSGAVLKLHNGNTYQSCQGGGVTPCTPPCTVGPKFATTTCWTGQYTQYIEISDNLMTLNSGANLVELAPQNANQADERLRYIIFERNLENGFAGGSGNAGTGSEQVLVSGVNYTLRNNIWYLQKISSINAGMGPKIGERANEPIPTAIEVFNNTCYGPAVNSGTLCIGFGYIGAGGQNSWAINNLVYGTGLTIVGQANGATGNTVTANSTSVTANPGFTDGSGSFSLITDFKPTANYTGAVSVPVWFDAEGNGWAPTWNLGAIHH